VEFTNKIVEEERLTKKQLKGHIYTKVSISMEMEEYSLDAQKDKLKKYADYQEIGEFVACGRSISGNN